MGEADLGGGPAGEVGYKDIGTIHQQEGLQEKQQEYGDGNGYFAELIICNFLFHDEFPSLAWSVQLLPQEQFNLFKGHHGLGIIPEIQRIGVDHILAHCRRMSTPALAAALVRSVRPSAAPRRRRR